jgi:hypothetical protein
MEIKDELIITRMSLDGHNISIPEGLSDLLNRAGAWKCIEPDSYRYQVNPLDNYDRKVVKENGKLRTYLTYKRSS